MRTDSTRRLTARPVHNAVLGAALLVAIASTVQVFADEPGQVSALQARLNALQEITVTSAKAPAALPEPSPAVAAALVEAERAEAEATAAAPTTTADAG